MSNKFKLSMFLNKVRYNILNSIHLTFVIYYLTFFVTIIFTNESFSMELSEMEKRSLKSRYSVKEPDFFVSSSSSQWIGLYFGVGFRKIRLNVIDDVIVHNSDGEANGIGVNLGYFWGNQGLEFERQTSIIKHNEPLNYENQEGELLEVIQNNISSLC